MAALLQGIGEVVHADVREAFVEQRFDGDAWLPRGGRLGFNLPGVILDFADGMLAPSADRFSELEAGRESGAMYDSIVVHPDVDAEKVVVAVEGKAAAYAGLFDQGGTHEPISINAEMRRAMRTWIATSEQGAEHAGAIRAAMRGSSYAAESPARPFLGVSQEAEFQIADLILEAYEE